MKLNLLKLTVLLLSISLFSFTKLIAQDTLYLTSEVNLISSEFEYLVLDTDTLSALEVWSLDSDFDKVNTSIVPSYNFGKDKTVWLRTIFCNPEKAMEFQLLMENSTVDLLEEYQVNKTGETVKKTNYFGQLFPYHIRKIDNPEFISEFVLDKDSCINLLYKLQNAEEHSIPILAGSKENMALNINEKNIFNGVFAGIFLVMFFYNSTLYFSTRYKIYGYYSIYVLIIGLSLFTWVGLSSKYLWPNSPWLNQRVFIFCISATAISATLFAREFLLSKKNNPIADKILIGIVGSYAFTALLCIVHISYAQELIKVLGISVLFILGYSIFLTLRGNKQASIYLSAWSLYLTGVIIYFLREFAIIEHTHFTHYMIHYGTAAEVILLSLALGNRINSLRKEKRDLIKKQNSMLEEKVITRTNELERTLSDLKLAQTQLVEAEKMASLGQLTAGVAHEINNPINFVSSNISPLKLDIQDLYSIISELETLAASGDEKKAEKITEIKNKFDFDFTVNEIENLISGINNGANRTAEIVKNLKSFSNIDRNEMGHTDIHEGLNSTLLILNSKFTGIEVLKTFGKLKPIYTLKGEINQLFMNVIDNSIYACHQKTYPPSETPLIKITTTQIKDLTVIKFFDNGIGMSEETLKRIYEPFFTSKPLGEGTGLGMSIVHGILQKLNGKLNIDSKEGIGTEITLTLKEI